MAKAAYIGIDLGTSGCRVIAIDAQQQIIVQQQQPLPPASQQTPQNQWQCVFSALEVLIRQCQQYQIEAIAVAATSGSVMICDTDGIALSPMLMYNDNRAAQQSENIATIAPAGSGAHGMGSGLAKYLYLTEQYKLPASAKLLHQADWINSQLGAPVGVTDYNNALKSGYDVIKQAWPDWIEQLISNYPLPQVVAPGTAIGHMSATLTQSLSLNKPPRIVAGTTDSIAGFIATGAQQVGDAVTSLGSTLVVKLISDKPLFQTEQGIYSHRFGQHWLVGGASNTGGAVLKQYFSDNQLMQLSQHIDVSKPAIEYYPLLQAGERFPINDPNLTPVMTPRPDSDVDFLHGLLDSIARIEQQAYQCLQTAGATPVKSIRSVGGGAQNVAWQRLRQQRIAVPFINVEQTQAAFGAATLARG